MIRSQIASRVERVKTMTFLCALLAFVLHIAPGVVAPTHAQGSRKDDIVFNSRGIPLAGATVRVCAMPASGQPCTPLALIYSDAALTQALANPTTTDGMGNYFFYAAPGKYEIEISGPQITTKQIPNVILPNDPSSPTFTGGISAFSLNLSGNLTVNGSTTVVGNLASGTLNLSNQSTPPGAAGSGTVNLYTKTTDKRLYYKDDTGTELGPLGPGAQTNAVNNWTAQQNFGTSVKFGGPDPYVDVALFGQYANASPPSTTASCTSASTNVTLAAALDFKDATSFPASNVGNGIVIYGCGSPTGLSTPPAPTVTPTGVINGSTTYTYNWVAEDLSGGLTAASPTGTTTVGAATLGVNSITLTQGVWTSTNNGTITFTCSSNCNVSSGSPIYISWSGQSASFGGNFTITSTPSGTTFTVLSPVSPVLTTDTGGGTMRVVACNLLTAPAGTVPQTVEGSSSDQVMRWWVYRNSVRAAVIQYRDAYYEDCGVNTPSGGFPSYLPTSPGSAVNKWLATTIVSGGGTTSIVLANQAGATVSGQTALHDNSQNLLAALNSQHFGTPVYLNAGSAPFNATTVFDGTHAANTRLLLPVGAIVSQPWVIRADGFTIEGGFGTCSASFQFGCAVTLGGNGSSYPVLEALVTVSGSGSYTNEQALNNVTLANLIINTFSNANKIAFSMDNDGGFGIQLLNVSVAGPPGSSYQNMPAARISGVTHMSWTGNGGREWSCSVPQTILVGPCIRFTNQSVAEVSGFASTIAHSKIEGGNVQGNGFQLDVLPNPANATGGFGIVMKKMLREQGNGPFLRGAGGCAILDVEMSVVDDDAPNSGNGNGFIDNAACSGGSGSFFYGEHLTSSVPAQVFLAGPGFAWLKNSGFPPGGVANGPGNPQGGVTTASGGSMVTSGFGNGIQASGLSAIGYAFSQPAPPSAVLGGHGSCSSNCIASGSYYYAISAIDVNNRYSTLGSVAGPFTTDGTQTITVSWTPQNGQVTTNRCRGTSPGNMGCATPLGSPGFVGATYQDTTAVANTVSPPQATIGNAEGLSASGTNTHQLNLTGNGWNDAIAPLGSTGLTANRTQTIPDVTGYIPVTSYINSAYDNATRANGAIGSNWTLTNNGINIASNNFVGTAGTNDVAYWSASPFSNVQFSQVTLTALNGTTDFPGVAVLLSGSGSSTHGYNCVEDTTNIFIQKINGTSNTTLTSASSTGSAGDILRLEVDPAGNLTCYKNGASSLTVNDTTYTSGTPGLFLFGTVATSKNWSGGNLHPLAQLDTEQDWTRTQHFTQGIALGGASSELFNNNPRAEQNVFLPGALTSTWTGATWTSDKAVTITRVQVQAKTAPSGCSTNAVVRLTDGTTPVNVTISAAANDSGAISQNYSAGSSLTVAVQTAAAGCTTSPADANVVVQYRMQ